MKQVIISETVMQAVDHSSSLFGRGGITVYPARTSEEIALLHRANRVDLIITDRNLPEMGGFQLCSQIRSDSALRDVSIIMVCTNDQTTVDECRNAGANAVLTLPIDPAELFSKIAELLVIPPRQAIRALLRVTVSGHEGEAPFAGISHNISISGMLVETERPMKRGDHVTCSFSIGSREIGAGAVVMREVKTTTGRYQYGVKFTNLDTKSLIIIEQFVSGRIKR
jgi:CheY-like chemotaxis protein